MWIRGETIPWVIAYLNLKIKELITLKTGGGALWQFSEQYTPHMAKIKKKGLN